MQSHEKGRPDEAAIPEYVLAGRDEDTEPHHAAEVAVLGAMVLSYEARAGALEMLADDDFDRHAHRTLFQVIAAMHNGEIPIDGVTINDELARIGKLDEIGGLAAVWLLTALEGCPTPAAWPTYSTIVVREARRRRGIALLRRAIERLEAGEDPARVAADMAVAA